MSGSFGSVVAMCDFDPGRAGWVVDGFLGVGAGFSEGVVSG